MMAQRITDQDTYRTPGQPDNEADLRAALHAAVEAGVIEGWRYAFPREHVDEWRISLTSEQARALFCECPCPTLCYMTARA